MSNRQILENLLQQASQDLSQEEFSDLHEIWKVACSTYASQMKIHGDLWNFRSVVDRM